MFEFIEGDDDGSDYLIRDSCACALPELRPISYLCGVLVLAFTLGVIACQGFKRWRHGIC